MKIRSRRLMALLLSAAMVLPYSAGAYAEDAQALVASEAPAETKPQTEAQTQPATQAPTEAQTQPATQAPTEAQTQPATQAPTEAQTQPATQAPTEAQTQPATQPQTEPKTEPATQPQTEPKTESATQAQTEPQTQPATQVQTETQAQTGIQSETSLVQDSSETELQTESERETGSFEAKDSGVLVRLDLPDGRKLPESTVATLKVSGVKENKKAAQKVRTVLGKKQKAVSDIYFLAISLADKDGKDVVLPKGTKIVFSVKEGLDPGLLERGEGEIHLLRVGDKVKETDAVLKLSEDGTKLVSAELKLQAESDGQLVYAAAGLQNHENTGAALTGDELADLAGASDYSVVAGSYDGSKNGVILTAEDEDTDKKEKAQSLLNSLAEYSEKLADAEDSEEVRVVNLYADDKGNINTASGHVTDPLYGVAAADGKIDVTSAYVVVNIVAQTPDQEITVPEFQITGAKGKSVKTNPELAGHLVVNLVSGNGQDGDSYAFVPYTGSADADPEAAGVYLVPEGAIRVSGSLTGAVYAVKASVGGKLVPSGKAGKGEKKTDGSGSEKETAGEISGKDTEKDTEKNTEADSGKETGNTAETDPGRAAAGNSYVGGIRRLMDAHGQKTGGAETSSNPGTENTGEATTGTTTERTGTGEDAGQEVAAGAIAGAAAVGAPAELNGQTVTETSSETDESGTEVTAETGLAAAPEEKDFEGTLSVSVLKNDGAAATALPGVLLSMYERTTVTDSAAGTSSNTDTFVCSFASGDVKVAIPAGRLKQGRTYVIREVSTPAVSETGSEHYAKLKEAVFTISSVSDTASSVITLNAGMTDPQTSVLSTDGANSYLLTFTHDMTQSAAVVSAPLAETVYVKDPGGTAVTGSLITVFSEEKSADPNTPSSWKQEEAFRILTGSQEYDFTDLLKDQTITAVSAGTTQTAKFRIEEKAPQGLYSVPVSFTDLTFTYTAAEAAGQDTNTGTWKLTSRTPVRGETGDSQNLITDSTVSAVAFTDAYQADVDSRQIRYLDDTVLKDHLEGGSVEVKLGSTLLKAGTDYLVLDGDGAGNYTQRSDAEGTAFALKGVPERIVFLNNGVTAGSTVSFTGSRSDSYHFVAAAASGTFASAAAAGNGDVSYAIPAAALTSRVNATVNVSSFLEDGSDHVSSDIKVNVLGQTAQIAANPTAVTIPYTGADVDEKVIRLLKMPVGTTTEMVTGLENAAGFMFTDYQAVIESVQDDLTAVISVKFTSSNQFVDGTIAVSKKLFRGSNGNKLYLASARTFNVGVFADENAAIPVGDAYGIKVRANNTTSGGSVKFTVPVNKVTGSTYYVFELDSKGKPVVKSRDLTVQNVVGGKVFDNGAAVTLSLAQLNGSENLGNGQAVQASPQQNVVINNLYSDSYINAHPAEFKFGGSFGIQLRVVDAQGKELPAENLVAEFRVRSADGKLRLNTNQKITLKNAAIGTKEKVSFPVSGTGQDMSVTLMSIKTSAGLSLSKEYTLLTASYDNQFSKVGSKTGERTFTLKADVENQGPVVFVLRKNDTNEKASLTLTKSVVYKKTPIRVNATYYIGIFADAAHKQLLFKKALTLSDASSISDTLKVNINSQKNRTITLYFAETDRNGKVVKSGKKTGYKISIDHETVTLSPNNMNATVVVTNDVLDGTKAAKRLTDPNSGFAGDSRALADAQAVASDPSLASDEALSASDNLNSKTGDDTPVMQYLLLVLISGAAAAAIGGFAIRRRRRHG